MNNTDTGLSTITTTDICRYYKNGELDYIPEEHVDKIINLFIKRLKKGSTPESTLQSHTNCNNKYRNNHMLMADRYLSFYQKANEYSKQKLLDPIKGESVLEKRRLQCKLNMRKRRADSSTNPKPDFNKILNEYYDSLTDYHLGFVIYENIQLEIYCNIPNQYLHSSASSFHTELNNKYYFRNDELILPTTELTNIFLFKFDLFKLD